MRWKSKNVRSVLFTFAVVVLGLFLIPRFFPSHKAGIPKKKKPAHSSQARVPSSKPSARFPSRYSQPHAEPVLPPVVRTPFPVSLPPPRTLDPDAPKLVIVIDDVGHTIEYVDDFRRLGNRVTYAILPFLKNSVYFDRLSTETKAEVILHMPLESVKDTIPGPGLIRTNMSDDYVLDMVNRELDLLPHAIGANNHMGSKGSADPQLMELILRRLKQRNLIFLDSMTTSQSMGRQIGTMIGLPVLKRDIFLDNDGTKPAIRQQLRLLADIARKLGYAIGIGHYHMNTIEVLNEEIPRLEREGFQMVSLRDILRLRKS